MDLITLATLGGIAVLLFLSAFFSGSETALTAASRPHMHALSRNGDRRATIVTELQARQEKTIGTILLGNNLVNILASALATSLLINVFGEAGIVYATLAMTALVLVFGEVMPKTYAVWHADQAARSVAPIFRVMVMVISPVTRGIEWVVGSVLRILGIRPPTRGGIDEMELRGAIDLHHSGAPQTRQERAMLRSILDLGDVEVGMIMQHRQNIVAVDSALGTAEIIKQVLDSPHTRLPVWKDQPENIVGVLHAKALFQAIRAHPDDTDNIDVPALAAEPWFIPESTTLYDQLQAFRDRREHFALVVDEYGTLMGVVTLEDILEEIVGEISDEHDIVLVGVRALPDGSYSVPGDITVRDLNRRFDWRLPEENAATVAGLLIHEAKLIPNVGQMFSIHGFRFEVQRRQRNQITSIRLRPPARPATPDLSTD